MYSPLMWINLMLAVTLALVYTQRDLFADGAHSTDLVLITSSPPETESYRDTLAGVEAFERDFGRKVSILVGGESDRALARALKGAIAMDPAGISMPGHPNSALLLPFVTEALRGGSPVTFYSTPLSEAVDRFQMRGTGFIGGEGQLNGLYATRSSLAYLKHEADMTVVVMGNAAIPEEGTLIYGCLQHLNAINARPEYLQVNPTGSDPEFMEVDPRIVARLQQDPEPDIIFWDGGEIAQLTASLDAGGFDSRTLSVISFDPVTVLPKTEQVFVKSRYHERKFITCYFSLAQLHMTTQDQVAGLNVYINANL